MRSWDKIPLRWVLVVPFMLQIGATVGLVGYLSFRSGYHAIQDLAGQLQQEIAERIQAKLEDFLSDPYKINVANAKAIERGLLPIQETALLGRHFWQEIQNYPSVRYLFMVNQQGGYVGATRETDGSFSIDFTPNFVKGKIYTYATDPSGNLARLVNVVEKEYDARSRQWYRNAIAKNRTSGWSEVTSDFDDPGIGTIAYRLIYNKNRQVLGALGVEIYLRDIQNFLQTLQVGKTGEAFIIERSGLLIASSTDEPPYWQRPGGEALERRLATDSQIDLIRLTSQYLIKHFNGFQSIQELQRLQVQLARQKEFLQVVPYRNDRGLDWLIVVVIPETDFMAGIDTNIQQTIILCGLALAIATGLGIFTAYQIAGPIQRLGIASRAIAQGQLHQKVETKGIEELETLAESFNQMADRLNVSFTELEKSKQELEARVKERTRELSLSEEKFAKAFRSSPHPIVISQLTTGEILEVNQSFLDIFGYELEEVKGQVGSRLNLWANSEERSYFLQQLQDEQSFRNQEIQFHSKSGQILTILLSAETVAIDREKYAIFVANDITDRKRAEFELQLLNEQLKADNLRMGAELSVARKMQQMLLPKREELSQIHDLDIAGFMRPADEVGGDYYDVLQQDDRVKIGIGDVTGHGLESGVMMIMAQTAVRTLLALHESDPVKSLNALNEVIYSNVRRMNSDKNMTLTLLEYKAGLMQLSGQHEDLIIVRNEGKVERIDTFDVGFPLGIEPDISSFIGRTEVRLQSGELAVLYTDGITEAINVNNECYGLERLCAIVLQNRQRTAQEICKIAIDDLMKYIGNQQIFDDITLLIMKRR